MNIGQVVTTLAIIPTNGDPLPVGSSVTIVGQLSNYVDLWAVADGTGNTYAVPSEILQA